VLNAVRTLDEAERGQLANVLVDSGVVPAESQVALQEAVRVGGYVDKFSVALRVASTVWQHLWLAYGVFLFEAFFLSLPGWPSCNVSMQRWMLLDALLSFGAVYSTLAAGRTFAPAVEVWKKDALGKILALKQAMSETSSWQLRFTAVFDEVPYCVFKDSLSWLTLVLLLATLGACWLPIGIYQWLRAYFNVCDRVVLWFSLTFLLLRSLMVLSGVLPCCYLMWRLRRPPREAQENKFKDD